VAVTVAGSAVAACSDGGGDAIAPGTLPPIATTGPPTTVAPTTTVITPFEVRSGDTLGAIAAAHSVTVDAVLAANPEIASADDIHEGQIIQIPAPTQVTSPTVDR
jgi:LysM repeat protein